MCAPSLPDQKNAPILTYDHQDLILRLVSVHLEQPVQDDLVFEGARYVIQARKCSGCLKGVFGVHGGISIGRSLWHFRQRVVFRWGSEILEASEDKWTFWFRVKPQQAASSEGTGQSAILLSAVPVCADFKAAEQMREGRTEARGPNGKS